MCATRVPERVKLARAKRVMEPVAVYDCDCPSQPGGSSTHWWVNQRLGPTVRVALVESANAYRSGSSPRGGYATDREPAAPKALSKNPHIRFRVMELRPGVLFGSPEGFTCPGAKHQ